jgi:hypothetical protein
MDGNRPNNSHHHLESLYATIDCAWQARNGEKVRSPLATLHPVLPSFSVSALQQTIESDSQRHQASEPRHPRSLTFVGPRRSSRQRRCCAARRSVEQSIAGQPAGGRRRGGLPRVRGRPAGELVGRAMPVATAHPAGHARLLRLYCTRRSGSRWSEMAAASSPRRTAYRGSRPARRAVASQRHPPLSICRQPKPVWTRNSGIAEAVHFCLTRRKRARDDLPHLSSETVAEVSHDRQAATIPGLGQ